MVETLDMRLGKAFHALMEQVDRPVLVDHWSSLSPGHAWVDRLLAVYALLPSEQALVCQAVQAVLSSPQAREMVLPSQAGFRVLTEADCLDAQGRWLRPDRVLVWQAERRLTLIDFKWRVLPSEHKDYLAQLSRYGDVLLAAYPGFELQAVLIDALAGVWRCRDGELVHC